MYWALGKAWLLAQNDPPDLWDTADNETRQELLCCTAIALSAAAYPDAMTAASPPLVSAHVVSETLHTALHEWRLWRLDASSVARQTPPRPPRCNPVERWAAAIREVFEAAEQDPDAPLAR